MVTNTMSWRKMIDPDDIKKEEASPIKNMFKLDIKVYPVKCPHCGTMVEYDKPIYPTMYPIGKTKAKFSARKVKRQKASEVELQSVDEI